MPVIGFTNTPAPSPTKGSSCASGCVRKAATSFSAHSIKLHCRAAVIELRPEGRGVRSYTRNSWT